MQKLFIFFFLICIAKSALHSEKNQTTESFSDNWIILFDPTSLPTLEYICLKKSSDLLNRKGWFLHWTSIWSKYSPSNHSERRELLMVES